MTKMDKIMNTTWRNNIGASRKERTIYVSKCLKYSKETQLS